jgi:hypothetical protein
MHLPFVSVIQGRSCLNNDHVILVAYREVAWQRAEYYLARYCIAAEP